MLEKRDILLRTNGGLDIFRHFIPALQVNKLFKNPFYADSKASCNVFYSQRRGVYLFKDFGNEDFSGDCFWFASQAYGLDLKLDFQEVLKRVAHDLGMVTGVVQAAPAIQPKQVENRPSISKCEREYGIYRTVGKLFTPEELTYWKGYGIQFSTLKRFNVKSIHKLLGISREGKHYQIVSTPEEPIFAYQHGDDYAKVYRPKSNVRFLYAGKKDAYEEYIFGMDQLPARGEVVFLTGGEKDVMTLSAHGFPALALNSETAAVPEKLLKSLQERFRHTVLLYDCDETGKRAAKSIQEKYPDYHLKVLELPLSGDKSSKDISDFFKQGNTASRFTQLLREVVPTINNSYSQQKRPLLWKM